VSDNLDRKFWDDHADSLNSDRLYVLFEKVVDIPGLPLHHDDVKEIHKEEKKLEQSKNPFDSILAKEDSKIVEKAGPPPKQTGEKRESEISPTNGSSVFQSVYQPPVENVQSKIQNSEDLEDKYTKLYTEYNKLIKERNELKKKCEDLEIRNELTLKKDNALKQTTATDSGFQLVHLIIVAVISLLLGAFLIKSY